MGVRGAEEAMGGEAEVRVSWGVERVGGRRSEGKAELY